MPLGGSGGSKVCSLQDPALPRSPIDSYLKDGWGGIICRRPLMESSAGELQNEYPKQMQRGSFLTSLIPLTARVNSAALRASDPTRPMSPPGGGTPGYGPVSRSVRVGPAFRSAVFGPKPPFSGVEIKDLTTILGSVAQRLKGATRAPPARHLFVSFLTFSQSNARMRTRKRQQTTESTRTRNGHRFSRGGRNGRRVHTRTLMGSPVVPP